MTGPQSPPPAPWPAPQSPPPYGDPQYGEPGHNAYPPQPGPRQLPLSKAAVTSLIFGIIGGVPLAYIFGAVGLRATGRNGFKSGRGFAIAGVVLATVWIAAVIGLAALNQSQKADRNADGTVTNSGTSDIFDLRAGDCLRHGGTEGGRFTQAEVVPCTQAHLSQVATQVPISGDGYDETQIQSQAESSCRTAVPKLLTADAPTDLQLFYLVPDEQAWGDGKRLATCVIASSTDLTKSYITS